MLQWRVQRAALAIVSESQKRVVVRIGVPVTRLREVGIASNRKSECCGEYVPGLCTHRPSHHGEWVAPEVDSLTFGRAFTTV